MRFVSSYKLLWDRVEIAPDKLFVPIPAPLQLPGCAQLFSLVNRKMCPLKQLCDQEFGGGRVGRAQITKLYKRLHGKFFALGQPVNEQPLLGKDFPTFSDWGWVGGRTPNSSSVIPILAGL